MNVLLITNNPAADIGRPGATETVYLESAGLLDVLYFTRDKIHLGHRLLTHPLSGSVKPGQTPYKSIVITKDRGALDIESLKIIEDSIAIAVKQTGCKQTSPTSKELLEDFQLIDLGLITDGIK